MANNFSRRILPPEEFTTKVCIDCGEEKPKSEFCRNKSASDGLSPYCRVCSAIRGAAYRKSEKGKAARKRYRQSPKGKASALRVAKRYLATEKGKVARRKAGRKYAESEHGKKVMMDYAASERGGEKAAKAAHKYRVSEKGRATKWATYVRRRAVGYGVHVEDVDEEAVYAFCGNRCAYCGSTEKLTLDHVVALSKGGAHAESNLLVACKSCNSSKGVKPVAEWLATRPMKLAQGV